MVQSVHLIWLYNNIDEKNNTNYYNIVYQLPYIEFIEKMSDEKAFLTISDSLWLNILPRVHNMSQVDTIFIFFDNKEQYEQWTEERYKIKGVYIEFSAFCVIKCYLSLIKNVWLSLQKKLFDLNVICIKTYLLIWWFLMLFKKGQW
jgi:hypothetical protein